MLHYYFVIKVIGYSEEFGSGKNFFLCELSDGACVQAVHQGAADGAILVLGYLQLQGL